MKSFGLEDPHRRRRGGRDLPELQVDCMFVGRRGEKELICALHAIDTEFLARTVIRADNGPIDFVIQGILEFLGEIGLKRIVIPAVKVLVQAVALHRGRDGDRGDSREVVTEHRVRRTRSLSCRRHGEGTPDRHGKAFLGQLSCAACGVLVDTHAQWLASQPFLDGYTAFQRYKGRIYNGEVCDLFLFKVPSPEEAKLDDRFHHGVWIEKTSRSDDHLIFDGEEVRKCRAVKWRPEYLRWDRVRVDAIDAHPQRPRPPREHITRDRPKRYITWAYIKKYGGTPNCKACAVDGPSHSKECRERFEAIFQKEDDEKAIREAADAAPTSAAFQDEAATSSMNPPTTTVAGADPMHVKVPRDKAIPTTITEGAASSSTGRVSMEQAQFDVEITEATPKRSELEEMPESWKVRKIIGLVVCSIDIVGATQADYDDPTSSDDELKRKAAGESDAVLTHEGEPMKSFEVPILERDIVGVKSGAVLDPVKVQVARQKEMTALRGMMLWSWQGPVSAHKEPT